MIILILIFSLALRLVNLSQSLWLDEAVQAITAQNSLSYIFQEITGDFHPPLYYFLMHFWVRFFGSSEIALRMPSVLFGVGTVYIVYKISGLFINWLKNYRHPDLDGGIPFSCAEKGIPRLVPLARNDNECSGINKWIAAVLLATAPFHIYYSQEARMYSMVTFFAALSMYFFVKINELTRLRINGLFILYFVSTVLMIYSDYYGFLILLAQGIYLLIKKKFKLFATCLPAGMVCYLLFAIFYLPWLPMFIKQIRTGMLATQMLPGWGKLVNVSFLKAIPLTFIKFTIGRITIFDKKVYALFGGFIIFFYGLLIAKGYFKGRKLLVTNYQLLITLWFFVPLIVSWIASLFVPNYQPFRLLLILPAFYLLLAMGVEGLEGNRWIRRVTIVTLLIINFVSLFVYYSNPYFHREDWRGLVKYLLEQKDSVTFLPSSASNWPIKYYDPDGKIKLLTGITGVGEIKKTGEVGEIINGDKVFYIRYLVPVFDPNELILAKLKDQGYTKTKEVSFNQIPLWEFSAD